MVIHPPLVAHHAANDHCDLSCWSCVTYGRYHISFLRWNNDDVVMMVVMVVVRMMVIQGHRYRRYSRYDDAIVISVIVVPKMQNCVVVVAEYVRSWQPQYVDSNQNCYDSCDYCYHRSRCSCRHHHRHHPHPHYRLYLSLRNLVRNSNPNNHRQYHSHSHLYYFEDGY